MPWQAVNSSWIREVSYDPESEILLVRFRGDAALFAYDNVPQAVFDALMASPSKGRYLLTAVVPVRIGERQIGGGDG